MNFFHIHKRRRTSLNRYTKHNSVTFLILSLAFFFKAQLDDEVIENMKYFMLPQQRASISITGKKFVLFASSVIIINVTKSTKNIFICIAYIYNGPYHAPASLTIHQKMKMFNVSFDTEKIYLLAKVVITSCTTLILLSLCSSRIIIRI